jgi:predicted NBD/HSP70 family sugar kinase
VLTPARPTETAEGHAAVAVVTRGKLPRTEAARVADGGRRTASAGAVLRAVLENGPIARSTIARITGLSPASVTGHCAELVQLGVLREMPGQVQSNGIGRPHVPVDLDDSRHIVAAVHIAVSTTSTALLDLRGRVLARTLTPHGSPADPDHVLERAVRDVAALCAQRGGAARPLGIGVATGGWVEPESGTVMDHPRLGWSRVPVRDWLSERTGLPVRVDGHSRALLHGEVLFGGARHADSVLHVFAGNVVEAAFATRGVAHYGSRAQAGVIAHLPVEGSRAPCSCGRTGCLEATVSEETLAKQAYQRGLVAAPDFRALVESACAGSRAAVELLTERSRQLGRAVAILMDVFGPDLVVVSDAVLPVLPAALAALRGAVRETVRMVCDVDRALIPTAFPGAVLETAGGAVILDALYRDPWGFGDRITSESCNVDIPGRRP